jgi:hypothetical protein
VFQGSIPKFSSKTKETLSQYNQSCNKFKPDTSKYNMCIKADPSVTNSYFHSSFTKSDYVTHKVNGLSFCLEILLYIHLSHKIGRALRRKSFNLQSQNNSRKISKQFPSIYCLGSPFICLSASLSSSVV